jgi:hypothetical protein
MQEAVLALQADAPSESELQAIVERGDFRPTEDEYIGFWFARVLTVRENLRAVIDEVLLTLDKPLNAIEDEDDLRYFLIGYAAMCLLIKLDRLMLFDVAHHSIVQRKLNEPFPEYRIPRKQFTRIFSSFVDQKNVLAIRDAMRFRDSHRVALLALREDADVGFIVNKLSELESSLNPSTRSHLKRAWSYVSHKWRRRGKVSAKNILTAVMEGFGRTTSEIAEFNNKNVTDDVRASIEGFLQPGDVIITRHAKALTNLFLPGFWPHAALYIGTREKSGGIEIEPRVEQLWKDDICVLEARKDGVRLRPLTETFSVDKFVVLRPALEATTVQRAIERALKHQGKMYNFDFDFFNSDRIVCTEVIYRAYDGLEGMSFPLIERAGRKTLTAENLLDFALDSESFNPVAIFGVAGCEEEILYGDRVQEALLASYRATPD